jgi:ribosomal protein S18 acetylase RimI-like enzyme
MKITIYEIRENELKNDMTAFVDTVYSNFIHLCKYPTLNHTVQEINRLITSPKFVGFMALNEKKYIMGYVLGEFVAINQRNAFFINYIYVSPDIQSKGLGTKLMKYVINFAKKNKADSITLMTDIENNKLVYFYVNKFKFNLDEQLQKGQKHEALTLFI